MKKNLVHIGSVPDGAIVSFKNSPYYYMKVCDKNGNGGVVRLHNGGYIPTRDLKDEGVDVMCYVEWGDIDSMYANEDSYEDECEEPGDIDNDCGFDPYLGCFTDDC